MRTRKRDHDPGQGSSGPDTNTPKKVRSSLRQTEYFMVGKSCKMQSSQLPTNADVIQHYLYLKEIHGQNSSNKDLIACSFADKVSLSEDCASFDSPCKSGCILGSIPHPWLKAGFPTISPVNLEEKIVKYIKKYNELKASRKRETKKAISDRKEFAVSLRGNYLFIFKCMRVCVCVCN